MRKSWASQAWNFQETKKHWIIINGWPYDQWSMIMHDLRFVARRIWFWLFWSSGENMKNLTSKDKF